MLSRPNGALNKVTLIVFRGQDLLIWALQLPVQQ
jgi:hypothetical protein